MAEAGHSKSTRFLRAAVLAAYSAKRRQTNAISSIIERSRGESILRASSTHWAEKCRYDNLAGRFVKSNTAVCSSTAW